MEITAISYEQVWFRAWLIADKASSEDSDRSREVNPERSDESPTSNDFKCVNNVDDNSKAAFPDFNDCSTVDDDVDDDDE